MHEISLLFGYEIMIIDYALSDLFVKLKPSKLEIYCFASAPCSFAKRCVDMLYSKNLSSILVTKIMHKCENNICMLYKI